MITIDSIAFKHSKAKKFLFDDYSLKFETGGVYGLFGKNGVGKSTLLYLIAGLIKPHKGTIMYNKEYVANRSVSFLSDIYIVPEVVSTPKMHLKDFISINAPFYPKFSYDSMREYLNIFEMNEDIVLGALSMGQTKKVIISFALSTNCSLILMDEPTNGLDIPAKSHFRRVMAQTTTDDKTIIISTHQVRDLEQIVDKVVIVKDNEVVINSDVVDIEKRLYFEEYPVSDGNALWECTSTKGYKGVFINSDDADSTIDIEILFNAAISNSKLISNLFNNSNR